MFGIYAHARVEIVCALLYGNTNALLLANISTCLQLSEKSLDWG